MKVFNKIKNKDIQDDIVLRSIGICPICNKRTTFTSRNQWLRDHYLCDVCGSIPRERALMVAIDKFVPDWRNKIIHESSPVRRGVSLKLETECGNYIASQYFPEESGGGVSSRI